MSEQPQDQLDEAWQQIAGLRLRLRNTVQFYQHQYRNRPWLIIEERHEESYFRCSASVEPFLQLLDGSRSVEQARLKLQQSGQQALSREDIVMLIANLKAASLLHDEMNGETAANAQQGSQRSKTNSWLRPFSIRFALFDPDRWLEKTLPYVKPLFSFYAWVLWLVLVGAALAVAWLHWPELADHGEARFADPKNLLWYWLLYPLIKALHELGHAYATKVWGGNVREMGIMLLVFFPVPYVDSSTANRFSSKNRRMLVSAAGIMVEVFLASLAMMLWINTEPGLLHDLAFDILIIGGVSTLLFNANPLLRFDGYYLLCELLEIPNLGTRSSQYIGYLFRRYALGIENARSPVTDKGEIKWLSCYGICAGIYRIFISLFIAFWVAGMFFIVGLVLALWAVLMQIIFPAVKWFYNLLPVVRQANRMGRFALVMVSVLLLALTGLTMPVGHSTYAEGVVNLPENAFIRAGTDGIVSEVLVADGVEVDVGDTLIKLENLELATRKELLLARLDEASARQKDVLLQDRTKADILKAKVAAIQADLDDVQAQIDSLAITSAVRGLLSLPQASDLPGRYVERGDVIGYVADLSQVSARVVIPQVYIDAVRRQTLAIEVRLRSRPGESINAAYLRELPQVTDRLPSRLLGSNAGGEVAVDARDEAGVQAITNIFQVEIALPMRASGRYLGQRIYVRFIHDRASLGEQLLHRLTHFMLQEPFV